MAAARGDRKPCTHARCPGTMQFGRQPVAQTAGRSTADGERGWVCSGDSRHFQLPSEERSVRAAAGVSPYAKWADDGGAREPVNHSR